MIRVHGTAVAVDGVGVLIRGIPGAGKSDLALRLLDAGAVLVADDQVEIAAEDGGLTARVPEAIAGLIEVRGLGIFRLPHAPARLGLVVDLVAGALVERLPEAAETVFLGIALPRIVLDPGPASAAAKVRLAARAAAGSIMKPR